MQSRQLLVKMSSLEVSIAVHRLDETVDVYGLTEAGYLDRRKQVHQRYLMVHVYDGTDFTSAVHENR